ncbi:MAG: DUF4358 domain-containing protein [Clostridia bacterium]
MKYKFKELICIFFLVVFVLVISAQTYTTYKSASEIGESLIDILDVELIYEQDENDFEDEFSFSFDEFDSVIYYSCDEVMSVQELLIVKLNDTGDTDALVASIEEKVSQQIDLFDNYADTQADLLKNAIIETKGNFVFYCVGENAQACYDEFKIIV